MPTSQESVGFTGKGGKLSISTDGTAFTQIKQVQKFSQSGQKANFSDITNLDSPGAFIERIPTTLDGGTFQATVVANPADPGQLMLLAAFQAQTKLSVEAQYPPVGAQATGLKKAFSAYVSSAPAPSASVTDASTFDFELTVTGRVNDTPGA